MPRLDQARAGDQLKTLLRSRRSQMACIRLESSGDWHLKNAVLACKATWLLMIEKLPEGSDALNVSAEVSMTSSIIIFGKFTFYWISWVNLIFLI